MTTTSIHLSDANGDGYSTTVYTEAIPRVGDTVWYWVDYPRHILGTHGFQRNEPCRITGTVARVSFEYRVMRYGGTSKTTTMVTMVSVFLNDYAVKYPDLPFTEDDL